MEEQCTRCFSPGETVIGSPPGLKTSALYEYLRLQQHGLTPTMCGDACGKFRVCYARPEPATAARSGAQRPRHDFVDIA